MSKWTTGSGSSFLILDKIMNVMKYIMRECTFTNLRTNTHAAAATRQNTKWAVERTKKKESENKSTITTTNTKFSLKFLIYLQLFLLQSYNLIKFANRYAKKKYKYLSLSLALFFFVILFLLYSSCSHI